MNGGLKMLTVEMRPLDWLCPAQDNPKKHPRKNIERIAASIREYGWTVPILARPDGEIIAGHGRRLAAVKLGIEEVPVILLDLTDEQADLLRIADNRAAEAPWDHAALDRVLQEITDLDALDRLALSMDEHLGAMDTEQVLEPPQTLDAAYQRTRIASQVERLPDEALDAEIVVIPSQGAGEALVIVDDDVSDLATEVRSRAAAGEPIAAAIAERFFPLRKTHDDR